MKNKNRYPKWLISIMRFLNLLPKTSRLDGRDLIFRHFKK